MSASSSRTSGLRRIGLALFMAGFATFSLIYCTQPLLPEFAREFGVTPAESSLALSLTTGCLAVSILLAGALSEMLGRRGLMFVCMAGAAILNLISSVAPNWTALLVTRALEGVVLGGVPAVAMAYLAEEIPKKQLGFAMGLYVGGTAFGGMIGRVAIGALTEVTSWRVALGTMACVDFLFAVLFIFLLPRSRNFTRRPGFSLAFHLDAWGGHLRNRDLPWLFLTGFLAMGAFVTVYNYAGFRLIGAPYNLNQTEIGLIFLAYILGMAASSLAGALADRFGRARIVMAGAAVTLLGLVLTLLTPLAAIIAGICIITIGFFATHAVASGWVGSLAARNKSHASSLYLLGYYIGSSVLGSVGGWFWHEGGWPAIVVFCGCLVAAILAIAVFLGRRGGAA